MYQIDAHLTRDLTKELWVSFDATLHQGGEATLDEASGEELDNFGVGFTFGYSVNENLSLTIGYKSTLDDEARDDLRRATSLSRSCMVGIRSSKDRSG